MAPAERTGDEARELGAVVRDDAEGGELAVADGSLRLADPPHAALDLGRVRIHAWSRRPLLPLDLEPRLLGLVREQVELLETRLEAELAERVGDDVRGARHLRRAGGPRTDADGERFDEVHARECKGPPAE